MHVRAYVACRFMLLRDKHVREYVACRFMLLRDKHVRAYVACRFMLLRDELVRVKCSVNTAVITRLNTQYFHSYNLSTETVWSWVNALCCSVMG